MDCVIILLTTPYVHTNLGIQGTAGNFQQRMANLRKENSQLVSQSQRLLDQLGSSSSHKLVSSNSTVGSKVADISMFDTSLIQHQQANSREEEVNSSGNPSLLERERREWSTRQASLQQQVADAQAECR